MKLPRSYYNWLSIIGSTIAVVSFSMIVFLFVVSAIFFKGGSSYLGLFIFIILPVFLVTGLILIPIGMYRRSKELKSAGEKEKRKWPRIDFNQKRTRNAAVIFGLGTAVFLLLSAVGSYEAFHYTESVEFCGTICHKVMKPEYVAYQHSSHARVPCVDCHVGSGANWYVRSKLSGLYQVYAVTLGDYPKPIPTPIRNLRPARETCEECHWPEKFYARQLIVQKHYLPDAGNTEWDIYLQMKTGPTYSALGLQEGIHWHINPDVVVEYVAVDSLREELPWVRYTNKKTGESYVFEDSENPVTQTLLDSMEIRVMDCMDCHNRPSHAYQTPIQYINDAITAGNIPQELPDIKYLAMEILGNDFPSEDSAFRYIEQEVRGYYEFMYEDIYSDHPEMVTAAINGIRQKFSRNVFPEMKVKWDVYPDHISHLEFPGCFRCHNGRHQTKSGRVISMDCNLCHTILAQGVPDTLQTTSVSRDLDFVHPNDPNQAWKDHYCFDCHRNLYW